MQEISLKTKIYDIAINSLEKIIDTFEVEATLKNVKASLDQVKKLECKAKEKKGIKF